MNKIALLFLFALPCLAADKANILWDQYGVPHIFAASREEMFYSHGWAQMRNQADLILRLYGESRGRGAEYWGPSHLELDRWVQLNGVPELAKQWYEAQDPQFRKYLDAFARGMNDYAKANLEAIGAEFRVVLPVSGLDVIEHSLRAVHFGYMGSRERMQREVNASLRGRTVAELTTPLEEELAGESNTWAIGPPHSASGKGDADYQSASGMGRHILPVHGSAPGGSRLRPLRRAADRIPRARGGLQPQGGMVAHREYHRHSGLLQAHREGRQV
jgi:acyl-homoserine-lactone acylase